MPSSTCRWVRPRLALLSGGELVGLERRQVERHLLSCETCRHDLEELREVLVSLRRAGQSEPATVAGPSLWPGLARQIRETRRPDAAEKTWGRLLVRPLTGLAAALALSAAVGLLAVRWERTHAGLRRTVQTASTHGDGKKIRKATIVRPVPAARKEPVGSATPPLTAAEPAAPSSREVGTRAIGLTQ